MTDTELARFIDFTLLRPQTTGMEAENFLEAAAEYPFASVCVPPIYVSKAVKRLEKTSIRVGTVAGFPLGFEPREVKLHQALWACDEGASEIDMVMNISAFRSGDYDTVAEEISSIKGALSRKVLKVIIEACYLSDKEKIRACGLVAGAGADFVKTSTGFGPGGATAKDVRLLCEAAEGRIKVKAAGGIRTLDAALEVIEAGADRIGTSSGVEIIEELKARKDPQC